MHDLGDHRLCQPDECLFAREWFDRVIAVGTAACQSANRSYAVVSVRTGEPVVHGTHIRLSTAKPQRTAIGRNRRRPLRREEGRCSWCALRVTCTDGGPWELLSTARRGVLRIDDQWPGASSAYGDGLGSTVVHSCSRREMVSVKSLPHFAIEGLASSRNARNVSSSSDVASLAVSRL
jgi:hypothetical protein